MRLNLGCGTVIFPISETDTPYHIKPEPEEIHDGEWINVDKYKNKGVDEQIDLFRYPWVCENGETFEDNSADFIYCSHIVEHIPHEPKASKGYVVSGDLDGFFEFFRECWRILKPNGILYVASPFAFSNAGFSDPTHTRYITPSSFSYLCEPTPNTPFDYHVPMLFEPAGPPGLRFFGEWAKRINETPGITADDATTIAMTQFNSCDEIRFRLKAVKGV
jgi:SAM-dependent methyltransferase